MRGTPKAARPGLVEQPRVPIRPGLESCGLAAADTTLALGRLAAGADLRALGREIETGQLLTKRTAHGRRHILSAIRRRYVAAPLTLPTLPELATVLAAVSSSAAKNQMLLPYLLLSDRAAFELVDTLVLPRRLQGADRLSKADVIAALEAVFRRHRRKAWSTYLCRRWSEGMLSVLREVGALGRGAEREQLLSYAVRPEAFCFHLWGLYGTGLRGRALADSPFWRLLLLDGEEARRLIAAVAERGWWKFTKLGAAEEVLPVYHSPIEWAAHELG